MERVDGPTESETEAEYPPTRSLRTIRGGVGYFSAAEACYDSGNTFFADIIFD